MKFLGSGLCSGLNRKKRWKIVLKQWTLSFAVLFLSIAISLTALTWASFYKGPMAAGSYFNPAISNSDVKVAATVSSCWEDGPVGLTHGFGMWSECRVDIVFPDGKKRTEVIGRSIFGKEDIGLTSSMVGNCNPNGQCSFGLERSYASYLWSAAAVVISGVIWYIGIAFVVLRSIFLLIPRRLRQRWRRFWAPRSDGEKLLAIEERMARYPMPTTTAVEYVNGFEFARLPSTPVLKHWVRNRCMVVLAFFVIACVLWFYVEQVVGLPIMLAASVGLLGLIVAMAFKVREVRRLNGQKWFLEGSKLIALNGKSKRYQLDLHSESIEVKTTVSDSHVRNERVFFPPLSGFHWTSVVEKTDSQNVSFVLSGSGCRQARSPQDYELIVSILAASPHESGREAAAELRDQLDRHFHTDPPGRPFIERWADLKAARDAAGRTLPSEPTVTDSSENDIA